MTAVSSVSVDDTVAAATTYRWNSKGRIEFGNWSTAGDFELNLTGLTRWSEVAVTYTYGLATLSADIAAAVASAVAALLRRQATNPSGVQSESLGAYQVSYGDFSARLTEQGLVLDLSPSFLRRWSRTRQLSVPFARYR